MTLTRVPPTEQSPISDRAELLIREAHQRKVRRRLRWAGASLLVILASELAWVGTSGTHGTPPAAAQGDGVPVGAPMAQLTGSDTVAGDGFGSSLAISGSTLAVGADGHANSAGRAYVFTRSSGGWHQVTELKGSDTVAGDLFGGAVAASGTTVVVGAANHDKNSGRAYVFTKTSAGWNQVTELKGSDTGDGDFFGASAAISSGNIIVSAPGHGQGRAYVFAQNSSGWKQVTELQVSKPEGLRGGADGFAATWAGADSSSNSVAISGTTAIVGEENASDFLAYVFTKTSSGWKQTATLGHHGSNVLNSVAISGHTAIVGQAGGGCGESAASVFSRTATGWRQLVQHSAHGCFALSVDVSGATVIVSDVTGHSTTTFKESAQIYRVTQGGWRRTGQLMSSRSYVGQVAVSGSTGVIAGRNSVSVFKA